MREFVEALFGEATVLFEIARVRETEAEDVLSCAKVPKVINEKTAMPRQMQKILLIIFLLILDLFTDVVRGKRKIQPLKTMASLYSVI